MSEPGAIQLNVANNERSFNTYKNLSTATLGDIKRAISFYEKDKAVNDEKADYTRSIMNTPKADQWTPLILKSFMGRAESNSKKLSALRNELNKRNNK